QSAKPSIAFFAWPAVVIVVAVLIVFSPWSRGIVKITTKFGALERRVEDTVQKDRGYLEEIYTEPEYGRNLRENHARRILTDCIARSWDCNLGRMTTDS